MNGYEQIIELMRTQGKKGGMPVPRLAEMTGKDKCDIGDLVLDRDDLMVADHLKDNLKKGDLVMVQRLDSDTYAVMERLVRL